MRGLPCDAVYLVMIFGAASIASTCGCDELFSFVQPIPAELTTSADGVQRTVSIRADAQVSKVSLIVANHTASPAPVQVELPNAPDMAPVRVDPGRSRTVALCTSPTCAEHFAVIVRSLGEPATLQMATAIEGTANGCRSLRVGATIE